MTHRDVPKTRTAVQVELLQDLIGNGERYDVGLGRGGRSGAANRNRSASTHGRVSDLCPGRTWNGVGHRRVQTHQRPRGIWRGKPETADAAHYGVCFASRTGSSTRISSCSNRGEETRTQSWSASSTSRRLWSSSGPAPALDAARDDDARHPGRLRLGAPRGKVRARRDPHITKKTVRHERHWAKFKDELFKIVTREGHEFAMKPELPAPTRRSTRGGRGATQEPQRYANTTMLLRRARPASFAASRRAGADAGRRARVLPHDPGPRRNS